MALLQPITNLETYREYTHNAGIVPTYQLKQCFACGLPGVWLYMKSIGLEDVYFNIINDAKKKSITFKELFYLLMLVNANNKFFPKIPDNLLNIEIPPDIAAAQIPVREPDFQTVFAFTREQLIETLEVLALPNKMIRLGNLRKSVGVMYSEEVYCVYHADNPSALEFKSIEGCVDAIMRAMK